MFKIKYSFSANFNQIKRIQKPNSEKKKKKGIQKPEGFQKPNSIIRSANLHGRKVCMITKLRFCDTSCTMRKAL